MSSPKKLKLSELLHGPELTASMDPDDIFGVYSSDSGSFKRIGEHFPSLSKLRRKSKRISKKS